jgi:hypothetical protein
MKSLRGCCQIKNFVFIFAPHCFPDIINTNREQIDEEVFMEFCDNFASCAIK